MPLLKKVFVRLAVRLFGCSAKKGGNDFLAGFYFPFFADFGGEVMGATGSGSSGKIHLHIDLTNKKK